MDDLTLQRERAKARARAKLRMAEGAPPPSSDVFSPIGLKRQDDTGQLFFESPSQKRRETPWDKRGVLRQIFSPVDENPKYRKAMELDKPWMERSGMNKLQAAINPNSYIPDDPTQAILGGIRDMAVGAATIPADLTIALGFDTFGPISEGIKKSVPEFRLAPEGDTAGEVLKTISQYAVPSKVGVDLAKAGLKKIAPSVLDEGAGIGKRALKYLAQLTGAAGADAVATVPDNASTLGDIFEGFLTDIQPDDSNIEKRLKVGLEAALIDPVLRGTGATLKKGKEIGSGAVDGFQRLFNPQESSVKGEVARYLQQETQDIPSAIKKIDESIARNAGTGFEPTTGKASQDPGLMRVEQAEAAKGGPVQNQLLDNERTIADGVRQFGERRAPTESIDKIGELAEAEKTAVIAPQKAQVDTLASQIEDVQRGMQDLSQNLTSQKGKKTEASESIDQAFRDADRRMTETKNRLYQEADPDGALKIDAQDYVDEVSAIKLEEGQGPEALPSDLINDVKKLTGQADEAVPSDLEGVSEGFLNEAKNFGKDAAEDVAGDGTVSFRYLVNLRQRISDALGDARANNQGARVGNLMKLKAATERQIDTFADSLSPELQDAAAKLREAQDFYADEFAPRFKQGTGGQLRKQQKGYNPPPASTTGAKFLKSGDGTGAKEAAQDLNRVAQVAENPEQITKSARDFLVSDMAESVGSPTGLKGKDLEKWKARFDAFKAKNKDTLAENKEVLKEVNQMRNRVDAGSKKSMQLEADLDAASEGLKRTEKEFNKSALGQYLNDTLEKGQLPEAAIENAIRSKDTRRMKQLYTLAKRDPSGQAVEGLKDLVRENISKRLVGKTTTATGDSLKATQAKVIDFFEGKQGKQNQEMIEMVFKDSPDDLATLRRYKSQLIELSRYAKGTAGSDTAALTTQGSKNNLLVNVAGAVQGLGGRVSAQSRLNILDQLFGFVGRDRETIRSRILTDALTNPELAKILLLQPTEKNIAKAGKFMRTYVANNVLDETLGDDEKRKKDNNKNAERARNN